MDIEYYKERNAWLEEKAIILEKKLAEAKRQLLECEEKVKFWRSAFTP